MSGGGGERKGRAGTFMRHVLVVLLCLTNRRMRDALLSLDRLEVDSAKQTRNADFAGQRSFMVRTPVAKSNSMVRDPYFPEIFHFRLSAFILGCDVHRLKI